MKNLIVIIVSIFFIVSCNKSSKEELPVVTQTTTEKFTCDLKEMPLMRRKPPHANPGNGGGNGGGGNGGGNPPPPPVARNVIFIDMDGGVTPPSLWSSNQIPYTDCGLSPTGRQLVLAEAKLAFEDSLNVIVTDRKSLFDSTPITSRVQINLAGNNWYNPGAGGVAYLGSFGTGEVAWVFTGSLGFDAGNAWKATDHEGGHTLGLYHQAVWSSGCVLQTSYRNGCNMGYAFTVTRSTWIIGDTDLFCGHKQHDIRDMAAVVGYKIR